MQEQTHQLKMEVLPQGGDSAAGGQRTSLGQTGPPGGPGGPTATSTATRVSQQAATPQQPTVLFTAPQQVSRQTTHMYDIYIYVHIRATRCL